MIPTGAAIKDKSQKSSRRGFLNWFLGTSAGALLAMIFYPVLRFMNPPHVLEKTTDQVEAGTTNDPELLEKGYKIVRFGVEPVLLVRVSEKDFRAFSAGCTHLGCIVEYQNKHQRIWCNCHNGEYDLTGRNVAGPPPKPLTPFNVHIAARRPGQAGTIVISRG